MKKKIYYFLLILMSLYSNAQEFTLQGTAISIPPSTYRLTQAVNSQAGLITNSYPLNLTQDFELNFELYFGTKNGLGADGIAFLMSNSCNPSLQIGSGIGVRDTPNSLIAEFDTYDNGLGVFDINKHHITIFKNGFFNQANHVMDNVNSPVFALPTQGNIDNNIWYPMKIKWEFISATSQKLSVYFNGVLRVTSTRNHIADSFLDNPIVFYSFGGSTGTRNNFHQVRTNQNSVIYDVCNGGDVTLIAPELGSNYSWSIGSSTTNSNTITPSSSGSVICNYTDLCGFSRSMNFTINSYPAIVLPTIDSVLPICEGQSSFFVIRGLSGLVVEYNINGVLQTITIPNTGSVDISVTNPLVNQTLTITKVISTSCSSENLNINRTLIVTPIPVTSTPIQTN